MDAPQFDALARRLGTRRAALGSLLGGLLLPVAAVSANKGKGKHRRKGKEKDPGNGNEKGKDSHPDRTSTQAQAEACWRAGICNPKKGANVSQCDLENYTPTSTLDCTGCNISRANLRGANLSGANLTRANLSGACLVDATLSGATVTPSTNLYNAIFCRTTMPDGSVNNSGCGSGTACCPTCIVESGACGGEIGGSCCGATQCTNGMCQPCVGSCTGKCDGADDGCGVPCTGRCPSCQTCQAGQCVAVTCSASDEVCCPSPAVFAEICRRPGNAVCSRNSDCCSGKCHPLFGCYPVCPPGCGVYLLLGNVLGCSVGAGTGAFCDAATPCPSGEICESGNACLRGCETVV